MLQTGATLQKRYTVERVLAQGGMGVVYLGRQTGLDQPVAIKEMSVEGIGPSEREAAVRQFGREAELLMTLDHPGLVKVSDHFGYDGSEYLVMEYVEGITLESVLDELPVLLPLPQVLSWLKQACEVLVYLHGQPSPVIMRDLKPGNLIVDSYDRIRLLDFGIAQVFQPNPGTPEFIQERGSPGFAPMEQYGASSVTDARSDLYSLGATAYALLTRTVPPESVAMFEGKASLTPPSVINNKVTAALEEVVLKMMALRPQDRYQSAAEVLSDLRGVARTLPRDGVSQYSVMTRCNQCQHMKVRGSNLCGVCHPDQRHQKGAAPQPTAARTPSGAAERFVSVTEDWSGGATGRPKLVPDLGGDKARAGQVSGMGGPSEGRGRGRLMILLVLIIAILGGVVWEILVTMRRPAARHPRPAPMVPAASRAPRTGP